MKNEMEWHEVSAKTGANELKEYLHDFASREVIRGMRLPMKEVYMSYLLHLFEDFDDDLLQDAMEELTA